jgi:CelD/BcsL family acetyltransferase involved in cellulose biosynthesis
MIRTELVETPEELERWRQGWDELAIASGRPLMLSDWALAWWRHRRPPGSALRAVVVRDGDTLIGFAPWFVQGVRSARADYRLLGSSSFWRIAPLARAGRETEIAAAISSALVESNPSPTKIRFEGVDADSAWPSLLAEAWPDGRGCPLTADTAAAQSAPTLQIAGRTHKDWIARQSGDFRKKLRVKRLRTEERGGSLRVASSSADFASSLDALMRLHLARWAPRGGSGALDNRDYAVLRDAGTALVESGAARIYWIEAAGAPIAALLAAAAGGEVVIMHQGFDRDWAGVSPGMQTMVAAIEDAFAREERRIDFGPPAYGYKARLADRDEPLAWITLVPPGAGSRRARIDLLGERAVSRARRAYRRLPPGVRWMLRARLARMRRG